MDWVLPGILLIALILVGPILGTVAFFQVRTLRKELEVLKSEQQSVTRQSASVTAGPSVSAPPSGDTKPDDTPAIEEKALAPEPPSDLPTGVPEAGDSESEETGSKDVGQEPQPALPGRPTDIPTATPAQWMTAHSADLEETVGAKWAVWVGGLALALGGIFLVRFSIEQGLLGPGARVVLGALFAVSVSAAGEWTRRQGSSWSITGFENANIPSILTAVGTLAGFATIYAAYALYGFLSPVVAFAGLTLVTLATMAAALLHGPLLAGLGILASFLVPFLVSTEDPSVVALAAYAIAVSLSAFGVARLRLWRWMAIVAALGLVFWGAVLEISMAPGDRPVIALYLVLAWAVTCYVFVTSLYPRSPAGNVEADHAAWPLLSLLTLLMIGITAGHADFLSVIVLVMMIAGPYAIGQQWPASRYIALVAGLATAMGYAGWELPIAEMTEFATGADGNPPDIITLPGYRQEMLSDYAVLGVCLALIGGLLGVSGTLMSAARAPLAVAGSFLPILIIAIAYARVEALQISVRFAILSLLAGMVCLMVADNAKRRLPDDAVARDAAVASWLIAALTALVLGLCMMFDRGVLTVALGLVAAIVALVYQRYPLKPLRPVAVLAALLWFARVVWDPAIVGDDLGTTPVFNWLLFGYGVPAAGFALAAWLIGRQGRDIWLEIIEGVAITAVTVSLAVIGLHALDPSQVFSPIDTLAEAAMLVIIGGGMALGLMRLSHRRNSATLAMFADGLGILGMAGAGLGLLAVYNPLWTGEWIGSGLFLNVLLFAYFLTGILYAAIGYVSSGSRMPHYNTAAIAFSGLLLFAWVTLTIRQGFHQGNLKIGGTGDAELYVYSAVWLVIGIAMLLVGLATGRRFLRLLSGAIIVAVVLKVFVVDMASLTGFLRALSFIGLGAVLVAIGLIYQRLLRGSKQVGPKS